MHAPELNLYGFTLKRLKDNLDRLHKSVTEMSNFETLQRINAYRKTVHESLDHAFSVMPHIPAFSDLPAEVLDSTKHRLHVGSGLRLIDSRVHVDDPFFPFRKSRVFFDLLMLKFPKFPIRSRIHWRSCRYGIAIITITIFAISITITVVISRPLLTFIATACACLLFSSIFHLFLCRSAEACG